MLDATVWQRDHRFRRARRSGQSWSCTHSRGPGTWNSDRGDSARGSVGRGCANDVRSLATTVTNRGGEVSSGAVVTMLYAVHWGGDLSSYGFCRALFCQRCTVPGYGHDEPVGRRNGHCDSSGVGDGVSSGAIVTVLCGLHVIGEVRSHRSAFRAEDNSRKGDPGFREVPPRGSVGRTYANDVQSMTTAVSNRDGEVSSGAAAKVLHGLRGGGDIGLNGFRRSPLCQRCAVPRSAAKGHCFSSVVGDGVSSGAVVTVIDERFG